MPHRSRAVILLLTLLAIFVEPAHAITPQAFIATATVAGETPPPPAAVTPPAAPPNLVPEQVDGYVAGLTDEQARAQLLRELKADAEQLQRLAEAAASGPPAKEGFSAIADHVEKRLQVIKERAGVASEEAKKLDWYGHLMLMTLTDQEGWPAVRDGIGILALLLALGGMAEWGLRRSVLNIRRRIGTTLAATPLNRLGTCATLLFFDALALATFFLIATVSSFMFYDKYDPLRAVTITALLAVVFVRAAHLAAKRVLSGPGHLFPVSEAFAVTLIRWITGISTVLAFALSVPPTLSHLGLADVLSRAFVQPVNALILLLTLAMMWRMRAGFLRERRSIATAAAAEHAADRHGARTSSAYFVFATAYGVAVYAVTATSSFLGDRSDAILAYVSLLLVMAAPSIVGLVDRTLDQVAPRVDTVSGDDETGADGSPAGSRRSLRERIKTVLLSGASFLLLGTAFVLLLEAWRGGMFDFATSRIGKQIVHAFLEIYLAAILAYIAWQMVEAWAARLLEKDETAIPIVDVEDAETSVRARSRMGTLAPLIRAAVAITLLTLVSMSMLSSLGVDIGPLLAGAGVIGLAIGFGAQTLVRDVLSGVFFLVDDAFRVGEYIEIDSNLRGEVERLTIRSMQLRHHRGPLLTLPYGNLRAIINHNRDFAIYKQEFRLPYDTDLEKVRKIIKKIGQEMLADPELGPKFLQPLKSQGVIRIEESALIIRTKFVCKPREQFVLRRIVFQRVQEALHAAGIEFAFRKVHVQVDRDANEEEEVQQAAAGAAMAAIAADEERMRLRAPASDR